MRIHTVFSLVGCSRVPVIGSASYSELVEMIVPIVHLIRQFGGNLRNLTANFFHIKIKLNYFVILVRYPVECGAELSNQYSTSLLLCTAVRKYRYITKKVLVRL